MQQQNHSQQFLRQQKFFTVFPLIALPFITLLFWALGGGSSSTGTVMEDKKGVNTRLPDASFEKAKPLDKMSYYDRDERKAAKMKLLKSSGSYYSNNFTGNSTLNADTGSLLSDEDLDSYKAGYRVRSYSSRSYADSNEAKVYRKLDRLNKALNQEVGRSPEVTGERIGYSKDASEMNGAGANRLENRAQTVSDGEGQDPEMQQINDALEKILDIQHPRRVEDRLQLHSEQQHGQVFAVSAYRQDDLISLLTQKAGPSLPFHDNTFKDTDNGFYSLESESLKTTQNAIQAEIYETQTVVSGSIIKFRLINGIYTNGVRIPKGNFVFGIASLNGERLNIIINSIRYKNSLFPVSLSVYDLDGLSGIYIPGAISRKAAKESADRSIQGISSLDPSWQTQAAEAGIEAAQNLLSKKVKLVKVTVKAGYQVLLYDKKQSQVN